jgi:hypothetical protein
MVVGREEWDSVGVSEDRVCCAGREGVWGSRANEWKAGNGHVE